MSTVKEVEKEGHIPYPKPIKQPVLGPGKQPKRNPVLIPQPQS